MRAWRVTVVDGLHHRYQGFGIVLSETADDASRVVAQYLTNATAYGKPFEVSDVQPHDHPEPHVVLFNWGEWDGWPPEHETSLPTP